MGQKKPFVKIQIEDHEFKSKVLFIRHRARLVLTELVIRSKTTFFMEPFTDILFCILLRLTDETSTNFTTDSCLLCAV